MADLSIRIDSIRGRLGGGSLDPKLHPPESKSVRIEIVDLRLRVITIDVSNIRT